MCCVCSVPNHVLDVRVAYVGRSALLPGSPISSFFSFVSFFIVFLSLLVLD